MQGRGGRLGGRSGGGRGRSGGSGRFQRDEGPPDEVVEVGHFMHECENEMVYKLIEKDGKVPYFNAGVYLQNKKKLGKVDEIFGPINEVMFTVKPDNGIIAKSFVKDDAVYIGTDKLLPMERFTNPGKPAGRSGGRGGGRGSGRFVGRGGPGGRGGRGGFSPGRGGGRGGFSPGRGGGRGGFSPGRGGGRGGFSPGRGGGRGGFSSGRGGGRGGRGYGRGRQ